MHTGFIQQIRNCIPLLLIFASSCAKEIYTHEDAANAKRHAQKTGLTVMIRNINQTSDMGGFAVSATQCGEHTTSITSADGIASLMLVKGDAILRVTKDGYATATAVVTTSIATERGNTVVIVPVFADGDGSGSLDGTVSVATAPTTEEPLADALVSIHLDMDELMQLAFPGAGANYRPGALAYASNRLMQPVRTSASGTFRFAIPATVANLTYTVNVHETALSQRTYCSANQAVVTNGRNNPAVFFHLTPYEK